MAAVLRRCVCGTSYARSLFTGKNGCLKNIVSFKKDSWITKAIISSQVIQHRNYVPSDQDKEYEKLWEAVTGGRGTGRGKRKSVVKGVDPKLLKYGIVSMAMQRAIERP